MWTVCAQQLASDMVADFSLRPVQCSVGLLMLDYAG